MNQVDPKALASFGDVMAAIVEALEQQSGELESPPSTPPPGIGELRLVSVLCQLAPLNRFAACATFKHPAAMSSIISRVTPTR